MKNETSEKKRNDLFCFKREKNENVTKYQGRCRPQKSKNKIVREGEHKDKDEESLPALWLWLFPLPTSRTRSTGKRKRALTAMLFGDGESRSSQRRDGDCNSQRKTGKERDEKAHALTSQDEWHKTSLSKSHEHRERATING